MDYRFFHLFSVFFKQPRIWQQIHMKKCPTSIQCWDWNLWPLGHETPPITTRLGLSTVQIAAKILFLFRSLDLICWKSALLLSAIRRPSWTSSMTIASRSVVFGSTLCTETCSRWTETEIFSSVATDFSFSKRKFAN